MKDDNKGVCSYLHCFLPSMSTNNTDRMGESLLKTTGKVTNGNTIGYKLTNSADFVLTHKYSIVLLGMVIFVSSIAFHSLLDVAFRWKKSFSSRYDRIFIRGMAGRVSRGDGPFSTRNEWINRERTFIATERKEKSCQLCGEEKRRRLPFKLRRIMPPWLQE